MTIARTAIAVAIVALLLLIGAVVVVASIDQRALTERVVDRVLAASSERLGVAITAEGARGRLLPSPRVTMSGFRVEGRDGEPPMLEADEVQVHLRTWPLVRSFGREVEVRELALERPVARLVRDADGTWNIEALGSDEEPRTELTVTRVAVSQGAVHVTDRSARETSVALDRIDLTVDALDRERSRVRGSAALASAAPNVELDLRVDPTVADRAPALDGTVRLESVDLTRLGGLLPEGITDALRAGRATLDASVATSEEGHYTMSGDGRLSNVLLRRDQPMRGAFRFSARVDPETPAAFAVDLDRLSVTGPGLELGGRAELRGQPRRVTFALSGPLLDLDLLLGALPERRDARPREPGVLPPGVRRALGDMIASGTLRVERVVRGRLEVRDLDARARLARGRLHLERAQAALHGGRVIVSGSEADLREALPTWRLRTRFERVDVGAMMSAIAGSVPLRGTLDGAIDVTGAGAAWEVVRGNVQGTGETRFTEGALTTTDLGARVASLAAEGLRRQGHVSGRVDQVGRGSTDLRTMNVDFRVEDGGLILTRPLRITASFGGARLEGRVGLDQSLELTGTMSLAPELVERIVRMRPDGPVELPIRIGGELASPEVSLPRPPELARILLAPAARAGVRRLEQEVEERVGAEIDERRQEVEARIGEELRRRALGNPFARR